MLGVTDSIAPALDGSGPHLGYLARPRGDVAEAVKMYVENLSLIRAAGQHQGIAACLVGLAAAAGAGNAFERATRLLGSADAELHPGATDLFGADRLLYRQTQDRVRR